jgi:RHS repeat-associated protein
MNHRTDLATPRLIVPIRSFLRLPVRTTVTAALLSLLLLAAIVHPAAAAPDPQPIVPLNQLDQLTSRTDPAGTSTYRYDAFSRLTSATSSGLTRTYNYAAADSPQRIDTSLSDGAGALTRSERLTYGPAGLLQSQTNDQPPVYPLADAAGTLIAQIDEQGAARELPGLDPWGMPVGQELPGSATVADQPSSGFLGAAGRITLPGSHLTKLGARYYDPEVGSFLSVDPVTGDPAEPTRRAPYNYAASNPAAFVDPGGESFSSILSGAYGAVATPIKTKAEAIDRQLAEIANDPSAGAAAHTSANFLGPIVALASCENFDATALTLTTTVFPYGRVGTYLLSAGRGLGRLGPRLADEFGTFAPFAGRAGRGVKAESKLVEGARYPLSPKIQGQLIKRGWTAEAIDQAVQSGKQVRAVNKATGNPATRFIHPKTGQSVVIDDVTGQVIHVGGPGFKYGLRSGDVP